MTGALPPSQLVRYLFVSVQCFLELKTFSCQPLLNDHKDPLVGHSQYVDFPSGPNASLADLPRQLVYYRLPDFSRFSISPKGHPNTLCIMGSADNISGNGGIGTSTFITRRQDAVEFTTEATLSFQPDLSTSAVENEEAGITLFLQRAQHFDLGIVVLPDVSGSLKKFIRLRTFSANSSADGMTDAYSRPGIFPLADDASTLRLRVQAIDAYTYVFSYVDQAKPRNRTIVGYGAAREVSGGFTGVRS